MPVRIGTCSWNYESWTGLVYSRPHASAAACLPEYAARYRTAEIDSWFYRIPPAREVEDYLAAVDDDFEFTCKAPQDLSLTFTRGKDPRGTAAQPNPAFLSPELYAAFLERIAPLRPRIGMVMLEFEYLNRRKMPSRDEFMRRLAEFARAVPRDPPLGIECRNGPWLDAAWFDFLAAEELCMVFSEKLYLPPVTDLYARHAPALGDRPVVLRLLGGDRAEIEEASGGRWDRILDPKPQLPGIAAMIRDLSGRGNRLYVNVNNHFEGSAPLTIARLGAASDDFALCATRTGGMV